MGRPREFDDDRAIQQAMEVFWKQGYAATSVADLGASMGLRPGSLYNAFGDKHALFLAALDCYLERYGAASCAPLLHPGAGLAEIEQLFRSVVAGAGADPDRKGCLMLNATAELASHDPDVRARMLASRERTTAAFRQALENARDDGQLRGDQDVDQLASFLTSSLYGLQMTAKVVQEPAALHQIVDAILRALR